MARQDRDHIERETQARQHVQAVPHGRLKQPVRIGLHVNKMPDPDEPRILPPLFQGVRGLLRREQRHPSDDPGDGGPAIGDLEHQVGIGLAVGSLYEHGAVDASRRELRREFAFIEAAVQRPVVRSQPRIGHAVQVPYMLVSVYNGHRTPTGLRKGARAGAPASLTIAERMRSTEGIKALARAGAAGIRVSAKPSRTGAASSGTSLSATWASSSPPKPPVTLASCTTSSRRVRRTLASSAIRSNGFSQRASMTSTFTPWAAARSAAASTRRVIAPQESTVAASPVLRSAAVPISRGGASVTISSLAPR